MRVRFRLVAERIYGATENTLAGSTVKPLQNRQAAQSLKRLLQPLASFLLIANFSNVNPILCIAELRVWTAQRPLGAIGGKVWLLDTFEEALAVGLEKTLKSLPLLLPAGIGLAPQRASLPDGAKSTPRPGGEQSAAGEDFIGVQLANKSLQLRRQVRQEATHGWDLYAESALPSFSPQAPEAVRDRAAGS